MPCKTPELQREYMRKWIAARRASWFADKRCAECGSTEQLELHHLNRETKNDHKVWSWTATKREAELAQCIVLCAPCHRLVTRLQIHGPLRHGTHNTYCRHKCRCNECRAAHARTNAKYRKRKN